MSHGITDGGIINCFNNFVAYYANEIWNVYVIVIDEAIYRLHYDNISAKLVLWYKPQDPNPLLTSAIEGWRVLYVVNML